MDVDKNDQKYARNSNRPIKKSDCLGCEDDFYNGKNELGVDECWLFKTATMRLRKRVSVSQVPPWTQKPGKYPSCYKVRGYVFVDGDRQR